jgi:hypothetical protein
MKLICVITTLVIAFQSFVLGQAKNSCANFQELIKTTYNFKPAQLADAERNAKSAAMDRVWNTVKANPNELLPCLRTALEDPSANSFFRFDGSNLLVELESSPQSKVIQVRSYTSVDLDDVDLRMWVTILSMRGAEGFDTSEAGARWLSYPRARYYLPEHGAYEVNSFEGALFLYGSMEESKATPALLKIVSQANHMGREYALRILMSQTTSESIRALKQLDLTEFSDNAKKDVRKLLEHPKLLSPRAKPKTTREEFLSAFKSIVNGNWSEFLSLVAKVPDGEKDVVAVMKAEDSSLIRQVRRQVIAKANQHAIGFYKSFTDILMTLTWKYELRAVALMTASRRD